MVNNIYEKSITGSKKILPLDEKPKLKAYQHDAFAFSILNAHENFSEKWFLNSFLYLKVKNKMFFYDVPSFLYFWNCFVGKYLYVLNKNNFINQIKKSINNDEYVYLVVNERYIPKRKSYRRYDFNHSILVYGYNDEKGSFITVGYQKDGKFVSQWIKYDVLKRAYLEHQKLKEIINGKQPCVAYTLKIKNNKDYSALDFKQIKKQIKKQLVLDDKRRGIGVYEYIKENMLHDEESSFFDLRCLRLICEHKWIISILCKELNNDSLNKNAESLYEYLKVTFNLAFKYNITREPALVERVFSRLKEAQKKEVFLLSEIQSCLNYH